MAGSDHLITDAEAMGEKAKMTHEEVLQLAELTPEEKEVEKKLRIRIDSLIMPLVVLVYLLNYIDRCVSTCLSLSWLHTDLDSTATTMPQPKCRVSLKISTYQPPSTRLVFRFFSSPISSCRSRVT